MNVHIKYDENKFEFDIPKTVTISYIKDLISKITNNKELEVNIMYNNINLLNYTDKVLLSSIIANGEKTIKLNLEKKNSSGNNLINFSNISTSDTYTNDKYYKSLKNKFIIFNSSFQKIFNEISNFNNKFENSIYKLIKKIKSFDESIIKINEKLNQFYDIKKYNKLIKIFEENQQSNTLNDKELKNIYNEIEYYISNYKHFTNQNNFQNNILDFINNINNKFQFAKIQYHKIQKEQNYENLISLLDKTFTELKSNKLKNNIINDFENKNTDHLITELNESMNKTKKRIRKYTDDFPKIERGKTLVHFYTESQNSSYNESNVKNSKAKTLKLFRKGKMNTHKNFSLPSFNTNPFHSNQVSPVINNKSPNKNYLPELILDSNNSNKKRNKNSSESPIKNKIKVEDDKINQSMNIEVKPKIMDKNITKNFNSRNNINRDITPPINKTVNNLLDSKIESDNKFDIMNLKPMKRIKNTIPSLFEYSISKDYLQDRNYPFTERDKTKDNLLKNDNSHVIQISNQSKIINNIALEKQNLSEINDNKKRYKIIKNNKSNDKENLKNEYKYKKEYNKKKTIHKIEESDLLNLKKNSMNSTMKFINLNHEKKKIENNILTLSEESVSIVKENLKKSEIQNKAKENKLKESKKKEKENNNKNSNKENNIELNENRTNSIKIIKKTDENELIESNNENSDIIINSKRRENNLEQIEKLTRDLLGYKNDKKTKTLNPISNLDNKENENENSFNDVMTEDEKKKRRKYMNVYDFII